MLASTIDLLGSSAWITVGFPQLVTKVCLRVLLHIGAQGLQLSVQVAFNNLDVMSPISGGDPDPSGVCKGIQIRETPISRGLARLWGTVAGAVVVVFCSHLKASSKFCKVSWS